MMVFRQGQDEKLAGHTGPSQMRNQEARATQESHSYAAKASTPAKHEFKVFLEANRD